MDGLGGFDLDGETSRAWSAFTRRLADRLADMSDGEQLTLDVGGAGVGGETSRVRMHFTVPASGRLRRTELAADDQVLSESEADPREADRLADETVTALRDVHGVMHPAFLVVTGESYGMGGDGPSGDGPDGDDSGAAFTDSPIAQMTEPTDPSHLLELAFAAITNGLGREPTRDIDGDLIVETGSTRVFVRVLVSSPVIQLFSRLVHNIAQPRSAPAVVATLNSDYPFIKFLFADASVLAYVHVPAIPFVPAQLRHMLAVFSQLADELDDQLVRRLGGEREIDASTATDLPDPDQPEGVPPELMRLVRLDPDNVGLDPEETAEVCGYDRALTRQLLHIAAGQEEVWRQAAEEASGDPDEVARCTGEAVGWASTRRSLDGALQLIDSLEE